MGTVIALYPQQKPKQELKPLERTTCIVCKKSVYKNGTIDGTCAPCWNKRPKFVEVKTVYKLEEL